MTTSTPEKVDGLKALEGAIEKIKETISQMGGTFHIQMAVSEKKKKFCLCCKCLLIINCFCLKMYYTAKSCYSYGRS